MIKQQASPPSGPRGARIVHSVRAPGLRKSQRAILELLKRRGCATIPRLAKAVGLSVETVRDHLKTLKQHGLVRRDGSLKNGPGRPEIVYRLAPKAEALFPRREGEILQALASYLKETGNEALLRRFFKRFIDTHRAEALVRVEGLEGQDRLAEVARILSELGFMAVVEETSEGSRLRLCHCPLRELVEVTGIPCRAEIGFVTELLGESLTRESYIPSGDASCTYRLGAVR